MTAADSNDLVHHIRAEEDPSADALGRDDLLGVLTLLDCDEGPSSLSRPGNAGLYTDEGLAKLEGALRPGGVVAIWSVAREVEMMQRLNGRFQNVAEIVVPADSGLEYVYRARRQPPPPTKPAN